MDFDAALDLVLATAGPVEVAGAAPPYIDFPLAEHGLRYARLLAAVRMVKSPAEIERLRTAAQAAVRGYAAGLGAAHAGQTEEQLLSAIGSAMYANGCTASTHALFLNAVAGRDRFPLVDAPGS